VVELQEVVAGRWNVYGRTAGGAGKNPRVVVNSHLDTVPPFFASSVDATHVRGRGACDTKSLIAAQLLAAQQLVRQFPPSPPNAFTQRDTHTTLDTRHATHDTHTTHIASSGG
jgi:acetylornithine deacetylase/succinyl-diaminopimelate desuccinylase-like protein